MKQNIQTIIIGKAQKKDILDVNTLIPFAYSLIENGVFDQDLLNSLNPQTDLIKVFENLRGRDIAYQSLDLLIDYYVKKQTKKLKNKFNHSFSFDFYDFLLRPYFNHIICLTFSRFKVIEKILLQDTESSYEVTVFDLKMKNRFIAYEHFYENFHYSFEFNEWVVSALFHFICNNRINLKAKGKFLPSPLFENSKNLSSTFDLLKFLKKPHQIIYSLSNYLKIKLYKKLNFRNIYGFGVSSSILFSILLYLKGKFSYRSNKKHTKNSNIFAYNIKLPDGFDANFLNSLEHIISETLPENLDLNFDVYVNSLKRKPTRTTFLFDSVSTNDPILLQQALVKEKGLLAFSQHGSGYSTTLEYRSKCYEFQTDIFALWGKEIPPYGKCKFITLPSPMLSKIKNKHRFKNESLIFSGTCLNPFWDSILYPDSSHFKNYFHDKNIFWNTLDKNIFEKSFYKIHPYRTHDKSKEVFLDEYIYITKNFPNINILSEHESIQKHLSTCRLLILDHYGTTLYRAMVSNTPTILYFGLPYFEMRPNAHKIFSKFREVGILANSAHHAAEMTNLIWNNVEEWWSGKEVQQVRNEFCELYAQTSDFCFYPWLKLMLKL